MYCDQVKVVVDGDSMATESRTSAWNLQRKLRTNTLGAHAKLK